MKRRALCVLALFFLSVVPVTGQKENRKPRIVHVPPSNVKAEAFLELSDADRVLYTAGLMDGFYASAIFGASNETVANLSSCTKDMDSKQVSAIITKYVKEHPEGWHLPASGEAFNALSHVCPNGLRIIERKN
jgi:hypothetical protein